MPVAEEAVLIVPAFPAFSQVAIASLLKVARSTVQYWIESEKLTCFKDNVGERYVLRAEVVRFIREYIRKAVDE